MNSDSSHQVALARERMAAFSCGVFFLLAMLLIALFVRDPSTFQFFVFRVILSLAAAGFAAFVPGFLTVHLPPYIRAGGALAVFVVVFGLNPASLVATPVPDPRFTQAMRQGEAELAVPNPVRAISYFEEA